MSTIDAARRRAILGIPVARMTDDHTSHEAAEAITISGDRERLCTAILAEIKRRPGGMTAGEIADALGIECHTVGRRTSDLFNAGEIQKSGSRRWHGTGRRQNVWIPAT